MSLWASLVIEAPAGRIYFVGDFSYGEGGHFRDARKQSATARSSSHFCLIGADQLGAGVLWPRTWNLAQLVKAFVDCGAERALSHHYGTFQLTDEPIDAPLLALADALREAEIPPERFGALRPGQVLER